MNKSICFNCCYYGIAGDAAPELVKPDCTWTPSEDDGWELPCQRTEGDADDEL